MKNLRSKYQPLLTLDYIVNEPENKLFDRKSSKVKASDIAPIISAFANADGCAIYVEKTEHWSMLERIYGNN